MNIIIRQILKNINWKFNNMWRYLTNYYNKIKIKNLKIGQRRNFKKFKKLQHY